MTALTINLTAVGTATAIALASVLWLPFAAWGSPRSPGLLWTAAPIGGLLFLAGVFGLQVALQTQLEQLLVRMVSPLTLEAWPIAIAAPIALVAALVQESARLFATLGTLRLAHRGRAAGAWTGALAGAGVGLFEAAWLLGAIPPTHFAILSAAVLERLIAIAFHIGAGALLGAGIVARRVTGAFVVAVMLHAMVDSVAALYQMGRASAGDALWMAAVIGIGLFLAMLLTGLRWMRASPWPDLKV